MNFSKILAVIQAVVALTPEIKNAVVAAESVFPAGTPGASKLSYVEALLSAAYSVEQTAAATWADVWPAISKAVTVIVATWNSLGIFKKADAAPTAQ